MANQIIFAATITPATAPMEVSVNGGASFTALTFTTVGSVQQGTLTGVSATSYAAGQLILRAFSYPSSAVPSSGSTIVVAAAAGSVREHIIRIGQSNGLDKSITGELATNGVTTAYPMVNNALSNLKILYPSAGGYVYNNVQNGVMDLSCSDGTDLGTVAPGGATALTPARGAFAGALALRLAALFPTTTYYYVKKSSDGQSMKAILTGGGWKADLDARLAAAKSMAAAAGVTYHALAVMVQYGEQDFYLGNAFGPLIDQFISEQTALGTVQADTKYIIGGLKDSSGTDKSAFRTQMMNWCAADPVRRKFINPSGYVGIVNDDLHLNALTQMQMGHSDFPNALLGTTGGYQMTTANGNAAPSVSTYLPVKATAGREIRFTGTNFAPTMSVQISGLAAPVVSRTGTTEVVVSVPYGAPVGIGSIIVSNPGPSTSVTFTNWEVQAVAVANEGVLFGDVRSFTSGTTFAAANPTYWNGASALAIDTGATAQWDIYWYGVGFGADLPTFASLAIANQYLVDGANSVVFTQPASANAASASRYESPTYPLGLHRLTVRNVPGSVAVIDHFHFR